jgi:hypothetical protein
MTVTVRFIGSRCQLRIDGSYVATYDNIEQLELATEAYAGQEIH